MKFRYHSYVACFAAAVLILSGWCGTSVFADEESLRLAPEDYPRIDGSTSTHPLTMLIACRITHTDFSWAISLFEPLSPLKARRLFPTRTPYDPAKRLDLSYERDRLDIPTNIHGTLLAKNAHRGTHESYVALMEGDARLIVAAREPSIDELEAAKAKGVSIKSVPIAKDAFVFLRHRANLVTNCTVQQIRDIYTGRLTNWSALGGPDRKITPYQRNRNSGSQVKMETLVMRGVKMIEGDSLVTADPMGMIFHRLTNDKDGIGYTVYYYDQFMAPVPEVGMFSVNGVLPSSESIGSGDYPFVTHVYASHLESLPEESVEASIRDWILTPEGQAVVAESGYVPIGTLPNQPLEAAVYLAAAVVSLILLVVALRAMLAKRQTSSKS